MRSDAACQLARECRSASIYGVLPLTRSLAQDSERPSLISALRDLESPIHEDVLNLAATLHTQPAHDEAAEPRTRLEHVRREQLEDLDRTRERLRLLDRQQDELRQRDRLRRVMSRLSRLNDSSAAYGDRVPSANNLYDWSPANEADDEEELDHILADLRRQQPHTHPEVLRVLGRSQLDSERERIRALSSRLSQERAGTGELRSTAILQSVRRHPRFSARTREYLQQQQHSSERPSEPPARHMSDSARQSALQRLEHRTAVDRPHRRSYLDHRPATASTPTVSPLLEQTVKYLSRIRHADDVADSWKYALDAGFLTKDYLSDDLVTDTALIPPPAHTSWLAPGAVLSGCQHATSVAATVTAATRPTGPRVFDVYGLPPTPLPLPPGWATSTPRAPAQQPHQDRWPVQVTIHAIDWEAMTLSATMEAYNVPSHPHSHQTLPTSEHTSQYTRTSSITTYLEGEILDFNQHTLLTESFKSSASTDATYWRKLPPFAKMSDDEVVRALTSRKWFRDVLDKDWVLMRWKERCFVKSLNRASAEVIHPPPSTTTATIDEPERHADTEQASFDDTGCGLTISGFYYTCLRRGDGRLEGLYFDPQSSPYQCLKLESRRGGAVGAWEFC
jgi:hypothetical protein